MTLLSLSRRCKAVSYTHLDVYKRQPDEFDFNAFVPGIVVVVVGLVMLGVFYWLRERQR